MIPRTPSSFSSYRYNNPQPRTMLAPTHGTRRLASSSSSPAFSIFLCPGYASLVLSPRSLAVFSSVPPCLGQSHRSLVSAKLTSMLPQTHTWVYGRDLSHSLHADTLPCCQCRSRAISIPGRARSRSAAVDPELENSTQRGRRWHGFAFWFGYRNCVWAIPSISDGIRWVCPASLHPGWGFARGVPRAICTGGIMYHAKFTYSRKR